MPATEELIKTRRERCFDLVVNFLVSGVLWLIVITCLSAVSAIYGGIGLWMYLEYTVDNDPKDCFDRVSGCEVLDVFHEYNASVACADVFTYHWKLPDSPVVFEQQERQQRSANLCLDELDVSSLNATFQPGIRSCFRLRVLFTGYADNFNCATVLRLNNATAGPCQTLLPPASDYDATYLLLTGGLTLVVVTVLCCNSCAETNENEHNLQNQP